MGTFQNLQLYSSGERRNKIPALFLPPSCPLMLLTIVVAQQKAEGTGLSLQRLRREGHRQDRDRIQRDKWRKARPPTLIPPLQDEALVSSSMKCAKQYLPQKIVMEITSAMAFSLCGFISGVAISFFHCLVHLSFLIHSSEGKHWENLP